MRKLLQDHDADMEEIPMKEEVAEEGDNKAEKIADVQARGEGFGVPSRDERIAHNHLIGPLARRKDARRMGDQHQADQPQYDRRRVQEGGAAGPRILEERHESL